MRGRRGTLQPMRGAGQTSPTLFAPNRTPMGPIAPSASSTDMWQEAVQQQSDQSSEDQTTTSSSSSSMGASSFSSASISDIVPSSPASSQPQSEEEEEEEDDTSNTHQSLVYSLQDENADLRKEIQSLEIVLRDHGFAKNGKQIIPSDEIIVVQNNNNDNEQRDGNNGTNNEQRAHMEMVSMMGMDPERPTVLTKYMEFKINELEDDLEKAEYDRDRFAMMVKNMTCEATAKETLKTDRLNDSKKQKRRLEEKLTAAMKLSKTRETLLSEQVGNLESDLDASHKKEDALLERISELEQATIKAKAASQDNEENALLRKTFQTLESEMERKNKMEKVLREQITALESEMERKNKMEKVLREQITALETNLEWQVDESTKREEQLRVKITALETNLEWNIDKSTKQENYFRDKISELETSNKTDKVRNHNNENKHEFETKNENTITLHERTQGHDEDDTLTLEQSGFVTNAEDDTLTQSDGDNLTLALEKSMTQEELFRDYLTPLKFTEAASPTPANADAFQQSISEISKYHNERLEEWKREESKEREEQLLKQNAALETNLEWNLKESKKKEMQFQEQITALETNLEWNIEESTKREALLQERIDALETKREKETTDSNSITIDSLVPPNDGDILDVKKQLARSKQQKKKLEEWLSKVVQESTKRENNLQQVIIDLESSTKVYVETETVLQARIAELESQAKELEAGRKKQLDMESLFETAFEKEFEKQERMSQEIAELEGNLTNNQLVHKAEQNKLLSKVNELTETLERRSKRRSFRSTNSNSTMDLVSEIGSAFGSEDGSVSESNSENEKLLDQVSGLKRQVAKLQGILRKNDELHKVQQDDRLSKMNVLAEALSERFDMAKINNNSLTASSRKLASLQAKEDEEKEILSSRVKELEEELQSWNKDKSMHADLEQAIRKTQECTSRIFELENELASYRKEKFAQNKKMARLQGDIHHIVEKNAGLSETITELENELDDEQQEKIDISERVVKLEGDLENLAIQQAPITAINDRLEKEAEYLRKNENIAKSTVAELKNEIESYRLEKFTKNKKVALLHTDIEEIAVKNEELSETVMELESDLEYERKEKFEYIKRVAELQSELENITSTLPPIIEEEEADAMMEDQSARSVRSRRIFEVEKELEVYRKGKFAQNKKITNLQIGMAEIAQKNEGLLETIMELESDLEYEQQEKSDRNKRIAELQSELENVNIQKSPINSLNAHLEEEAEANQLERKSLLERLTKVQDELDTTSKFFKTMKGYNQNLEIEHETLKAERDRLSNRVQILTDDGSQSSSKNSGMAKSTESSLQNFLHAELKTAKTEQERLRRYIDDLTNQLEEWKFNSNTEQERLHKCIEELTTTIEESNANSNANSNAQQEQERLGQRIEELTKELEESNSNSNTEQERLNKCIEDLTTTLKESNANSDSKQERLRQRIEELTAKLEESVSQAPKDGPEPGSEFRKKALTNKPLKKLRNELVSELKTELVQRDLEAELSDLKEEFLETEIGYKAREEELLVRIEALETELEFDHHEHERLERVIYVIRNELKMAAEIHEPVATRNKELEKELQSRNLEPVRTRNIELEKELESKKVEQESLSKELDCLKEELKMTNKTFHNNILDLKMKLKSKQSEFEHLNEFKHELEAELEEMTNNVKHIEDEFEAAAITMDTTYAELTIRNIETEKELTSYKSENQYLSKYIADLQNELAEKRDIKDDTPQLIRKTEELRKNDSIKIRKTQERRKSDLIKRTSITVHDELIDSENAENDDLIDTPTLRQRKMLPTNNTLIDSENDDIIESNHVRERKKLSTNGDSEEELQMSAIQMPRETDDDLKSSSSSKASGKAERERLASKISEIEKHLEEEKPKRESLHTKISELEEEKSQIELDNKPTEVFTTRISESEAELEVINAHIYELEADLEGLLDELWDFDQNQEAEIEEHKEDLDRVSDLDKSFNIDNNREHLSSRVLELEKEMEELEDELEETIERSKSHRQTLHYKNSDLEKKLKAAMKEKDTLTSRHSELERDLEKMMEKSRKDQQTLAIHYIEKERELKEAATKTDTEEKRLKSRIDKLEKEIDSLRDVAQNEEFLYSSVSVLLEDIDSTQVQDNETIDKCSNHAKENVNSNKKQERLIAKVSELKKQYDSKVNENQALHETIHEIETKSQSAQETIQRSEKEAQVLSTKYAELETKLKSSVEDHETAIWEAEQKMRDLIDTASLERKEKIRFQDESQKMMQDVEALRGENKENIETLEGENNKLTLQNESLEKAAREKEQEHETLKKNIETLEGGNNKLISQNESLEKARREKEQEQETLKETIESLQGETEKLISENESLEKTAKEEQKSQIERLTKVQNELDTTHKFFKSMKAYSHNLELEHEKLKTEREKAVRCIAELEQKIQSDTTEHELEKERIMNRIQNLQKQLETSAQEHENLSVQIQSHEAEKKEHSILSERFTALEKELQSTIEKSKSDRKLHLDLKMRLVEITMKNQAERANLDNRLFKLNKVLESTRQKNESLSSELKFFEAQKKQLDVSGVDDLQSTFEENDDVFRKIQSYKRGTSQDRTVTENTFCDDDDTLPSDHGFSPESTSESMSDDVEVRKETVSQGIDSNNNSNITATAADRRSSCPSILVESDGMGDSSHTSIGWHRKTIEDYLSPLVEKAVKVLGQEIPVNVVKGIQDGLLVRAEEVACEHFLWDDFESILEDVCQDCDQETWFDIQEAFFVAWEETQIQKMGHEDHDGQ